MKNESVLEQHLHLGFSYNKFVTPGPLKKVFAVF
jgi:hypothetical protein